MKLNNNEKKKEVPVQIMWAVCTSDGGFQHLLTLAFLMAFAQGQISSTN